MPTAVVTYCGRGLTSVILDINVRHVFAYQGCSQTSVITLIITSSQLTVKAIQLPIDPPRPSQ